MGLIMENEFYLTTLLSTLQNFKKGNPAYSLRAYSHFLGIHAGSLSSILKGKRPFPLKKVDRTCDRLLLTGIERQKFIKSIYNHRTNLKMKMGDFNQEQNLLAIDDQVTAKVFAQWEHFAILSLMNLDDFDPSKKWIADRLGLTLQRVQQVIANLEHVSLIEVLADGQIKRTKMNLRTAEDTNSYALVKGHLEELEIAKLKLENIHIKERDFSSTTMAINPEKIDEAKEIIRQFRKQLASFLEEDKRSQVYQLCIQLFPLSNRQT